MVYAQYFPSHTNDVLGRRYTWYCRHLQPEPTLVSIDQVVTGGALVAGGPVVVIAVVEDWKEVWQ